MTVVTQPAGILMVEVCASVLFPPADLSGDPATGTSAAAEKFIPTFPDASNSRKIFAVAMLLKFRPKFS